MAWGTKQRWNAKWDSAKTPLESLGKDWTKKFHVWGMDWDETTIELSVDGKLLNRTELAAATNPDGKCPFKQPHYLLVNLAVGGQNGGDFMQTKFPTRYEIDYIRVYQKS